MPVSRGFPGSTPDSGLLGTLEYRNGDESVALGKSETCLPLPMRGIGFELEGTLWDSTPSKLPPMVALELRTLLEGTLVGKEGGAMNRGTGLVSVTVVGVGPQAVQTVTIFVHSEG